MTPKQKERRRRDARIVHLRSKGLTPAAIVRRMAREGTTVSASTVSKALRRDKERRAELSTRIQQRIWRPLRALELWGDGLDVDEIAVELGVCEATVRSYVRHHSDYPRRRPDVKWERNQDILRLRREGLSLDTIGERFPHSDGRPLSKQRVSKLIQRAEAVELLAGGKR